MTELQVLIGEVPTDATPVDPGIISRWQGRFPELLLDVWRSYGFTSLAMGRLHLVDPEPFEPLMSYVFGGDRDLKDDTHTIAYGNFGELIVWSERHGWGMMSPVMSSLDMRNLTEAIPMPAELQIEIYVLQAAPEVFERYDAQGKPMHDRVKAALGPLPPGGLYATKFVTRDRNEDLFVENYEITNAFEWLQEFYSSHQITLVDWMRDAPMVRKVNQR